MTENLVPPQSTEAAQTRDQNRMLWLSAADFGVSETSTRYQRLSSLCRHYALRAITIRPLDERYETQCRSGVVMTPLAFISAARRARTESADIVSVSGEPLSLIAGVIAKAGRPFAIQIWDDPAKMARLHADVATGWRQRRAGLRLRALEYFTRWVFAQADVVVLSLDPDRIATRYKIPWQRLVAVPNGAVIEPIAPPDRSAYGQLHDPPLIVYTGPLQTARISTLIETARELHRRNTTVTIRLFGPVAQARHDPLIDAMLAQAPPNVEIINGLHDGQRLHAAVAQADVCVIPYRNTFEIDSAYPIKLFEYFSAAKPVVSTNLWGVRQVATDGYDIVMVPPDDPSQFADGIQRVLADPDLRCRLGRNARMTATRYSWTAINDEVLAALDTLIDTAGAEVRR